MSYPEIADFDDHSNEVTPAKLASDGLRLIQGQLSQVNSKDKKLQPDVYDDVNYFILGRETPLDNNVLRSHAYWSGAGRLRESMEQERQRFYGPKGV